MGMELKLTSGILATLRQEAQIAAPNEACGLLLGRVDAAGAVVTAIAPAANVAPDPARHFEIDPAALIAAHKAERAGGLALIGYYHSHPTGLCLPSSTDAAMAQHDGRVWAIIAGDRVEFWRDEQSGFEALSTRPLAG